MKNSKVILVITCLIFICCVLILRITLYYDIYYKGYWAKLNFIAYYVMGISLYLIVILMLYIIYNWISIRTRKSKRRDDDSAHRS